MTDRSVSWTDAASVARLLDRASAPRPKVKAILGRAHVARLPAKEPALLSVPIKEGPQAAPKRLTTMPPPPPLEAPPIEHTTENPADRLDTLLAWALDHHPCAGAFVADDNGLTLAAHGISEAHVALVGPLLSSLVAARTIPGIEASAGALWLGTEMMSWVEVRSKRGGFCLGVVGPEALSRSALSGLQTALKTTFESI